MINHHDRNGSSRLVSNFWIAYHPPQKKVHNEINVYTRIVYCLLLLMYYMNTNYSINASG